MPPSTLSILISFISLSVWAQELPQSIEAKIKQEQADYEHARAELLNRVVSFNAEEAAINQSKSTDKKEKLAAAYENKKFTRAVWETFFTVNWSTADKEALRSWHKELVTVQQQKAVDESQRLRIDLNPLRGKLIEAEAFCRRLPKGGLLHIHPYGTLSRSTVAEIFDIINPEIKKEQLEKYTSSPLEKIHPSEISFLTERSEYYSKPRSYREILENYPNDALQLQNLFFMPKDTSKYSSDFTPFERFLGAFAAPLDMLGVISGNSNAQVTIEHIAYERFFERSLANGVYYVELTRNLPVLKDSFKFSDRYDELLRWTEEVQNRGFQGSLIYPRTLLSFDRKNLVTHDGQIKSLMTLNQILSAPPSPLVVGINLMGSEDITTALDAAQFLYGKLLATSVNSNLDEPFLRPTIHAGELGDVRNLRDALIFGAHRIGHGIKFIENPVYLEMARRQGVAIETNLVSNEVLQIVPVNQNPYLYFYRLGLPVSLSTDDEGIFDTDISKDCAKAIAETNIEYTELRGMMVNSLATSFADPVLKAQLLEKLKKDFASFESTKR